MRPYLPFLTWVVLPALLLGTLIYFDVRADGYMDGCFAHRFLSQRSCAIGRGH